MTEREKYRARERRRKREGKRERERERKGGREIKCVVRDGNKDFRDCNYGFVNVIIPTRTPEG